MTSLRIGILGLGQIGGSIAKSLAGSVRVHLMVGFDLLHDSVQAAMEAGMIGRPSETARQLIEQSDTIIIALPINEILSVIRTHADVLRSKTLVTDTGSVKHEIMTLAAELGLKNFVGGHPLAGTEKRGIDSWSSTLFAGARYFVTANSSTEAGALENMSTLVKLLGADMLPVDAAEHDRLFALTSSLPHVIAYSLSHLLEEEPSSQAQKARFRGSSFSGATRVASSDPETVFQMLWHNRRNLSDGLTALLERLARAKDALDNGDERQLRDLINRP